MEKCNGFFDSKNSQYYVGDIVLNPAFNDLWLVEKDNNSYIFTLFGNKDNYYMPLDEPLGFIIMSHEGDKTYQALYEDLKKGDELMCDLDNQE